ncbi:MAG: hypothetical protein ACOY0T_22560 [Myxococcota bacterium]
MDVVDAADVVDATDAADAADTAGVGVRAAIGGAPMRWTGTISHVSLATSL